MRKTKHNPAGLERNSWGYRLLQLRHALGWGQAKLARVMGTWQRVLCRIERGDTKRPSIEIIRKIRNLETAYADVLKEYKKAPMRMDRLVNYRKDNQHSDKWKYGVRLLPIKIRGTEDIKAMGEVEADRTPIFFGRGSRKRMQETGMSVSRKAYRRRLSEAAVRRERIKAAARRLREGNDPETQSGQPDDKRTS